MNAILPENLEEATIAGMQIGESAYTMPWAMWADENRLLWLNPDYPAKTRPSGTGTMRIERTSDGFHVWPVPGHHYQLGDDPFQGGSRGRLPVVKVEP